MDECKIPGAVSCSVSADCVNKPGSFECKCRPGYTGDGINCDGKSAPPFGVWFMFTCSINDFSRSGFIDPAEE